MSAFAVITITVISLGPMATPRSVHKCKKTFFLLFYSCHVFTFFTVFIFPTFIVQCHVFKLRKKILGRVIDDLVHFRRPIFNRGPNPRTVLRVRGTNCTKFKEGAGAHQICFRFQISCSIFGRSNASGVEKNEAKVRTF